MMRRKEEEVVEIENVQTNFNAIHEGWLASTYPRIIPHLYYPLPTCFLCSLQSIAHAYRVYSGTHLHDIGFVEASLQAVFTRAASLNSWRLRAVLHIL